MDLRRWGEFAFGIGVFMCGGAFLLLAVERLSAPVVTGATVSSPIVAAASPPVTVAALAAPPVVVRRSALAPRAVVRRASAAVHTGAHEEVAAKPRRSAAPLVAAVPIPLERARSTEPLVKHEAPPPVHARQPEIVAIAAARRSATKRSPAPRAIAVANRPHRARIVLSRTPRSEATPEPPIGYDDHPALVRSDGPNAALPTMDPVQVELTTTHLGH